MSAISQAFDKAKAKITAELQDAGLVQQPDVGDVKPKESFIQRLPIEVIERVGDYVAFPGDSPKGQDNSFRGPSIVNPFTGRPFTTSDTPKANLLNFSQTCRAFRLASLRHLPELVRDITITSVFEMERIRDEAALRDRLSTNVRHVTLDFAIPLTVSKDRVKRAMLILCIHPSLPEPVFKRLEGLSFTSRFMQSYSAHENVRRDWQAVARDHFGLSGWQATVVGGLATFSTILAGGQNMAERYGDAECLFLRWDPSKGDSWGQPQDFVFKEHVPPPIPQPSNPSAPIRWLLTPFPPSSPRQPPLLSHPTIHASHLILSKVLATPRVSTSTPLRPLAAYRERLQNAYRLAEFDRSRRELYGEFGTQIFWSERDTALICALLVDKICFSMPEPTLIDALETKLNLTEN